MTELYKYNHDEPIGYELQTSARGTGQGVFATRSFDAGEVVMVGRIKLHVAENHKHASQVGIDRFVIHAGLVPMVNHSCDPNCGIRLNDVAAHDYVARRAIAAGEEITFDYAMRNYRIEHFPDRCRCGCARCRGKITGWADLPYDLRDEYKDQCALYLLELSNFRFDKEPIDQPGNAQEQT